MHKRIRPDMWGSGGGLGVGDILTAYESFKHPKLTFAEMKKKVKSLKGTKWCMEQGMTVEDRYMKNPDHLDWLIQDYEQKIADHESQNKKTSSKVRGRRSTKKADANKRLG